MRRGFGFGRQRAKRGPYAPGLTPVYVMAAVGDSQTSASRNTKADFPLRAGNPYYPADANAFLWDRGGLAGAANTIVQLTPGVSESQPNGPDTAGGFNNTIGWCGEFVRHWRAARPTDPIYFFTHQEGGGRFTDAASRGRAANWTPSLTDGAFVACENSWNAFVAALNAQGKTPVLVGVYLSMGANNCQVAGEATSFQTDMGTWESALRTRLFGSTVKFFYNYLAQLAGLAGFSANITTIRTAFRNLVAADPTHRELMNFDGLRPVAADNLHYDAASYQQIGEMLCYHANGWWYPLKEWTFLGGNQVVHLRRPGALINLPVQTAITGGAVSTARDLADGSHDLSQATGTQQPVEGEVTLASGLPARGATADGVDDILFKAATSGDITNRSFGWFMIGSLAAAAGKNVYGEGGESVNPFYAIQSTAAGEIAVLARDDAGTVVNPTLKTGAFNGTRNALAVYGTTGSVTGWVNGVAGTAQSVARGATTITRVSLYGLNYNAGSNLNLAAANINEQYTTAAVPDATYMTNYLGYAQRRWGT